MMKWLTNFTKGMKGKTKLTISGISHINYSKNITKKYKSPKLIIRDMKVKEMISTMPTNKKKEKRCGNKWLVGQLLLEYL